ncbi:MAG: hypothetical protein K8S54_18855 [Spirochaetia bacterium]|nr:hypothetical protein [Spirochaetia bacterium]
MNSIRLLAVLTISTCLSCKSTSPPGIPVSATDAEALGVCSVAGLEFTGVKRIGITVSDPSHKLPVDRTKAADQLNAFLSRDKRFRLIERERLSAVMQEQSLAGSGFLKPEEATRIGGIIPIDWILSASITEGERGTASGRFIDAVTGEVVHAFNCPYLIASSGNSITTNIANSNNTTTSSNTVNSNNTNNNSNNVVSNSNSQTTINIGVLNTTDPDRLVRKKCDSVHAPVLEKLKNLNSDSNVDDAARTAMRIPFDMDCGQIHFVVMDSFERNKFAPLEYELFLLKTLNGIDNVSDDQRAFYILRYSAYTGNRIDGAEWEAGLSAATRARQGSLSGYFLNLLNSKRESSPIPDRVKEILSRADGGNIGRPVAFPGSVVFYYVLSSIKTDRPENMKVFVQVAEEYMDRYAGKYSGSSHLLSMTSQLAMTYMIAPVELRPQLASVIHTLYAKEKPEVRFYEKLYYDIMYGVERASIGDNDETEEKQSQSARELKALTVQFSEILCRAPEMYDRPRLSTRVDQIHFLLRNGVVCPGLPTAASLAQIMRDKDWDEKVQAAQTLVQMRANAAPAEATVIHYFKIEGMTRSDEIREYCAQILGYTRTLNPEAHQLLIAASADFNSGVQSSSEKALSRIGLPVKPAILAYLNKPRTRRDMVYDSRRTMSLVQVLGRMGKGASDAIPTLDRISREHPESYIQRMAKNAIVNIQENRVEK